MNKVDISHYPNRYAQVLVFAGITTGVLFFVIYAFAALLQSPLAFFFFTLLFFVLLITTRQLYCVSRGYHFVIDEARWNLKYYALMGKRCVEGCMDDLLSIEIESARTANLVRFFTTFDRYSFRVTSDDAAIVRDFWSSICGNSPVSLPSIENATEFWEETTFGLHLKPSIHAVASVDISYVLFLDEDDSKYILVSDGETGFVRTHSGRSKHQGPNVLLKTSGDIIHDIAVNRQVFAKLFSSEPIQPSAGSIRSREQNVRRAARESDWIWNSYAIGLFIVVGWLAYVFAVR